MIRTWSKTHEEGGGGGGGQIIILFILLVIKTVIKNFHLTKPAEAEKKLPGDTKHVVSLKQAGMTAVFTGQAVINYPPFLTSASSYLWHSPFSRYNYLEINARLISLSGCCRVRWWCCPRRKPTCLTSTPWCPLMMREGGPSQSGNGRWWSGSCKLDSWMRRPRGERWSIQQCST